MEKGLFEKAGPVLVVGTVIVLCGAAVWLLLSREGNGRINRGGDKKQAGLPSAAGLPLPPGAQPNATPPKHAPTRPGVPTAPSATPLNDPDHAPLAGVPTFNQPDMSGPPIDQKYYPGPDPMKDRDPNVPDGPPADNQTYEGPPAYQPKPGEPDGPPMNGQTNPNQGPPQNQPNSTPNGQPVPK